jgi:patatin-like phospholipase/acyl hydrolase
MLAYRQRVQSNRSPEFSCAMPPINEQRDLRILCLDGGGVKGISSLCMLQEIMRKAKDLKGSEDGNPLKPCDYFDLICGTSTGGLIALMLGRLEYASLL